jgi:ribonuclease-3
MNEKLPESDLVERTEEIIGYRFDDDRVLAEALTHASVAEEPLASNERMEFLGDAILGFVVCEFLYNTFGGYREGELTKIKSSVVSRRVCAAIADEIGLTDLLVLGKGMNDRQSLPASVSAAVYESIVAAIYIDGGLDAARNFILRHMEQPIRFAEESTHQHNFKSVLQQYAQKQMSDLPTYLLLDEKGPDHSKCFEVCVEMHGQRFPSAWGQNKKEAEQAAALNALLALEIISPDDVSDDVQEMPDIAD